MTASPRDRLTHVVTACDKIIRYTAGLTKDDWFEGGMATARGAKLGHGDFYPWRPDPVKL